MISTTYGFSVMNDKTYGFSVLKYKWLGLYDFDHFANDQLTK